MNPVAERLRSTRARAQQRLDEAARIREQDWPAPAGVRIAGLAVEDSLPSFTQREVLRALGLEGDEFAERIFGRSGIERRQIELGEEFLARNLQGRAEQVEEQLFERAVRTVDRLAIDPGSIGTVLSSSLYSLACPTLAHRLVEHYGMDPATDKYHITGVGCASAVPLMRLAAQTLSGPSAGDVLIVAAESMSSIMMPAGDEDPRAKTVGSAIFGDGCAATLLSGAPNASGPAILATQVHHIADTLDAVYLTSTPGDSYLRLARELPDLAALGLAELVGAFLSANELDGGAVEHWLVHPGGRRIVENVRDALMLSDEQVAVSWQVLAEYGNVGTPSIFYVLAGTTRERDPQPGEIGLAVTIGPGVTVGLMLLQW